MLRGESHNETEMRRFCVILSSAALWTSGVTPVTAAEVYRWVGSDGVVHYSDEKPRDDEEFTTLEFAAARPQDYDPLTDPYSIQNQARRINESLLAIAQARDERLENRRSSAQDFQQRDAADYRQRIESGVRYFSPWVYSGFAPNNFRRRGDPAAAQRQLQAMQQLDLSGRRPASINSGIHRQRVQRSVALPVTGSTPNRRH
jgi:hypothetical protein